MPKANLLRFIDLLAMHKLNVLHLHLTDDQGWRLQILRYPRLTEVGSWRRESMVGSRQHEQFDGRPHGGFYTQDDIREIVAYAAERFITVVPEIDIPGHTQAAIASYPFLGDHPVDVWTRWGISPHRLNASDETVTFFKHVFDEVVDLFPSPFIGIGGDECGPQSHFIAEIQGHIRLRGRRIFGWDELLDSGVGTDALVAAWRGPEATLLAAQRGYDVVSCPDSSVYLDYRQSDDPREPIPVGTLLTLEDVWRFEPLQHERVIGAQCNIWTEHADNPRAVDYLAFPRLCAFAEAVWSPRSHDLDDFMSRLQNGHLQRLDALGVEYRPLDGPKPWQERPDAKGWPR